MAFQMLVISEEEINSNISLNDVINVVEEAFKAHALGKTILPPKYHYFMPWGILGLIPAYVETMDALAIKIAQGRKENPEKGLPTGIYQIILFEPETARPLAFMDGSLATALRTAAAAAVGAKYMARSDSKRLGIIGTGIVGKTSVKMMDQLFELEEVYAADISESSKEEFVQELKDLYPFKIAKVSFEEATCNSDILVTATPSREPLIKRAWIPKGLHISAIGADNPGKQELDPAILKDAEIVCDSIGQCLEFGELNVPYSNSLFGEENIIGEIGELVSGRKRVRTNRHAITVFDSTGMGIQDAAIARLIYDVALEKGFGRSVEI